MNQTSNSEVTDGWEHDGKSLRRGGDGRSYLNQLTRQRRLTAEEEIELARRARNGDIRARDRMVEANMRLVLTIAKGYRSSVVSLEDLVQEGAIGLISAAERFDPSRGYRFSTYATLWIKKTISLAIDNKARAIRIPSHVSSALRQIVKMRERLTIEQGESPSLEQVAAGLGISAAQMRSLEVAGQEPVSLDMLVGQAENATLGSLLIDHASANPEESVINRERQQELRLLLSTLNSREREIMCKGTGLAEPEHLTQDTENKPPVSREKTRRTQILALRKMQFVARRQETCV